MAEKTELIRGIVHVWVRNVRIVGYGARPNEYMPPGTVGDLEVTEVGIDGQVINALFHPGGEGRGYGLVMLPHWEYVGADEEIEISDEDIIHLWAHDKITHEESSVALGKKVAKHGESRAAVRARIATIRDETLRRAGAETLR